MAFQPVENGGSVVVEFSMGGGPNFVNVFGLVTTASFVQAYADAVLADVLNAYSHLMPVLHDSVVCKSITITDLREDGAGQFTYEAPELHGAEAGSQQLPHQIAGLISWSTGTRGRSYRGRTYISGFCENNSDGRTVGGGAVAAMIGFVDAMLDGPAHYGVISRYSGHTIDPDTGAKIPTPRDPAIISEFQNGGPSTLWATQRRRAGRP